MTRDHNGRFRHPAGAPKSIGGQYAPDNNRGVAAAPRETITAGGAHEMFLDYLNDAMPVDGVQVRDGESYAEAVHRQDPNRFDELERHYTRYAVADEYDIEDWGGDETLTQARSDAARDRLQGLLAQEREYDWPDPNIPRSITRAAATALAHQVRQYAPDASAIAIYNAAAEDGEMWMSVGAVYDSDGNVITDEPEEDLESLAVPLDRDFDELDRIDAESEGHPARRGEAPTPGAGGGFYESGHTAFIDIDRTIKRSPSISDELPGRNRAQAMSAFAARGEVRDDSAASYAYMAIAQQRLGIVLDDDADDTDDDYVRVTGLAFAIAESDQDTRNTGEVKP